MIKAELKNYRQSPRKVRLVADLIRGKRAKDAITLLTFTVKRSSDPIKKLLESAIANANHNFNIKIEDLFVREIKVDEGPTMKRFMPRAHGRAFGIKKRTSRVLINLDKIENKASKKASTKEDVKEVKTEKEALKPKAKKSKVINKKKTDSPKLEAKS